MLRYRRREKGTGEESKEARQGCRSRLATVSRGGVRKILEAMGALLQMELILLLVYWNILVRYILAK